MNYVSHISIYNTHQTRFMNQYHPQDTVLISQTSFKISKMMWGIMNVTKESKCESWSNLFTNPIKQIHLP